MQGETEVGPVVIFFTCWDTVQNIQWFSS